MENKEYSYSAWHTSAAVPTAIISYIFVFHFGSAIAEWALPLFSWSLPEGLGGGGGPNILRVLLISALSSWAAAFATDFLFDKSHPKIVVAFCAGVVSLWVAFVLFVLPFKDASTVLTIFLMIAVVAVPPLFCSFLIWRANNWNIVLSPRSWF